MTAVISDQMARLSLGIAPSDSRLSAVLATAIASISQHLDDICGPIVQRTITEVVEVRSHGSAIKLSAGPVASVTSVTVYEDGVPTLLSAETLTVAGGYLAELQQRVRPDATAQLLSGVLRRRDAFDDDAWECPSRVQVVYVAGRYASTTLAETSRFGLAAALALKSSWRAWEQSAVQVAPGEFVIPAGYFPGFTLPDAALELIARDQVHVVGIA